MDNELPFTAIGLFYSVVCAVAGIGGTYLNILWMAWKAQVKTKDAFKKYKEDNYILMRISYGSYIAIILYWFFTGMEFANFWFFTFDQLQLNMATILIGFCNHILLDAVMVAVKKLIGKWGGADDKSQPEAPQTPQNQL